MMDPRELKTMAADGPFVIRMNDGRSYHVESSEFITIGPFTAAVLHRDDEDGKMRHAILSMGNMSSAAPVSG